LSKRDLENMVLLQEKTIHHQETEIRRLEDEFTNDIDKEYVQILKQHVSIIESAPYQNRRDLEELEESSYRAEQNQLGRLPFQVQG